MSNTHPLDPHPGAGPIAVAEPETRGPFPRERQRIRAWRQARPFWAGLFTLAGSAPILYFPYATVELGNVSIAMSTMAGASSVIIGCLLILLAMVMWFQPQLRVFAGVAALVCGFVSFVTSNLGGFIIGLLCVVVGGTLAIAWQYDEVVDDDGDPAAGDEPRDGLGIVLPTQGEAPDGAPERPAAAPPSAGGAGLGELPAGSAASRPGDSTPDTLDGPGRMPGGAAKYAAVGAFPAIALVAALLPMAGPSDPLPPNPFADGPCVSTSPSASASASVSPSSGSAVPRPTTPAPGTSAPDIANVLPKPGASGSSTAPPPSAQAPAAPQPNAAGPTQAAPTPTPTGTAATPGPGLLDPLLGPLLDPLTGLLTAPPSLPNLFPQATPTPAATPAPQTPQAPAPTPQPATGITTAPAPKSASGSPSPGATGAKPSTTTSAKPSTTAPSASPSASGTKAATAKPSYPCPTQGPVNAKAAAAADPVLPDEPWILRTSLLAMAGMDYKGVYQVKTGGGKTKPVLKFEVSGGVDIWNLNMTSPVDRHGNRIHVFSIDNVKSYMTGGTVTFYTESLKGNLFGLIPIEFTPSSPPPLNVPAAFFTDVTVRQAGQIGATLVIPDMTMRAEKA